ncbi:MAG: DnaJ domain-containing protein [Cyclobacteriaceae bacterium]|nr:DnaJ domain-containing protein [Cyclobacteriaceae bacterium]MCH8516765.1 DnaJ domain-containing protein [Cyclobacteriaceae bacterium]
MLNYYEILEIPMDADTSTIKKAYRKLAQIYHPDVNKDPKQSEYFVLINEAYQTLSDSEKKANYDFLYSIHLVNVIHENLAKMQESEAESRQQTNQKEAKPDRSSSHAKRKRNPTQYYYERDRKYQHKRQYNTVQQKIDIRPYAIYMRAASLFALAFVVFLAVDYFSAYHFEEERVLRKDIVYSHAEPRPTHFYNQIKTPNSQFKLAPEYTSYIYPGQMIDVRVTPYLNIATRIKTDPNGYHRGKVISPNANIFNSFSFLIFLLAAISIAGAVTPKEEEFVFKAGVASIFFVLIITSLLLLS